MGSSVCQIKIDGKGLYLGATSGTGFETAGNGLYLMKKQGGLYDSRGLMLGPSSHLKYPHSWCDSVGLLSHTKILYKLKKKEIHEIEGNDGHIYRLKN